MSIEADQATNWRGIGYIAVAAATPTIIMCIRELPKIVNPIGRRIILSTACGVVMLSIYFVFLSYLKAEELNSDTISEIKKLTNLQLLIIVSISFVWSGFFSTVTALLRAAYIRIKNYHVNRRNK
ncbi:MAG: hypothetical protein ACYTFY_13245 [Planctomycetota bacterium]|jgi:hypothetical protein